MKKVKKIMDPHAKTSDKKGFWGKFESLFRTFRGTAFMLLLLPIVFLYVFAIATAAYLPMLIGFKVQTYMETSSLFLKVGALALTISGGYFLFAVTMIIVVPAINFLLPLRLRPMRTTWYSLEVIPWYYHNALVQLVRYTVLDLMTPTPLNVLFFKMMGMKIGKNVMINTSNISDPCLITLEDNVTIGGSATIFGHYGMKGFLIVEPTIVKKGSTIGLKASLMGDVIVEENSMVPAHEILLPKTRFSSNGSPKKSKHIA